MSRRAARRPPVRAPQQERSRRTLERLLDAAEAMIEDRTFDDAPVPAIVRRARSSVGSFYARFESKQALLEALLERAHDRMLESAREGAARAERLPPTLAARVPNYVAIVVEFCRAHRGVLRARLIRNLTAEERVPERQIRETREIVRLARRHFAACRGEIAHADPERALDFALQWIDSVAGIRLFEGHRPVDSFRRQSDAALVTELSRAVIAYLTAPPTRSRRPRTR